MAVSTEIPEPELAAAAGDWTAGGCPGVRRLEFSTTNPLQARAFLYQAYGWRLRVTGVRDLRAKLTVARFEAGTFTVSDVTLPADLTFEVTGRDALIVSTIIEGTVRVDRVGGTDRYRPGDVLIGSFPGTRYVCHTHDFRGHNFALPVSLLYAVAGLEGIPFVPLRLMSPRLAGPAARTRWRDTCDYVESLLAEAEAVGPLAIAGAARLLAATALAIFPDTATFPDTVTD